MEPPSKVALRTALAAARSQLDPEYRRRADAAIQQRVAGMPWFQQAHRIAAYAALPSEVQTDALLRAICAHAGAVALPVEDDGGRPRLVECADPGALSAGARGVRVPPRPWTVVDPGDIELILVPGLGFDRTGRRLGRGAGFYDMLLPQVTGRKVGLAYAVQVVDVIPEEPHDARLDVLVTEDGALEFA